MAANKGMQDKIRRVRPPRVHITTDVETGNAIEMLELPFVVGVLGDFSGQPVEPLPAVRDRKFVDVNPDTFDTVLAAMKPHLTLTVKNRLERDNPNPGKIVAELHFKSLEDFEPHRIMQQVEPMRKLAELRTRLNDLKGSLQGNPRFEELLDKVVRDTEKRDKLVSEFGTVPEKGN